MKEEDRLFDRVTLAPPPKLYRGPQPGRDSRELLSAMMCEMTSVGLVLDLGCGPRDQAEPIESIGHRYVGVDYSNQAADILAEAHCLPFAPQIFDCVFSYAVFEHLRAPFSAIEEVARVLKPNGLFIGAVSQGEPFHSSYFHHTAWGVAALCQSANLKLLRLWSGPTTLTALATMGRYPFLIKFLISVVDRIDRTFPWLAPRRRSWPLRERQLDVLYRAGSICFVMQKPRAV